jgi:hypothetical protein
MKTLRFVFLAAAAALTISGCGGGTGGTGSGGDTPTSAVSMGVMAKGSVIVNGVRFEDTTANISIDDTPKTAADLRDGMVVRVVGTVNADGITGTAQRVEAQIEVRGIPASVDPNANPKSLVVLGQTVFVDDQTAYSNLAGFGAITTSTLIEVHGLRDTAGRIRATRIEDSTAQMGDSTVDEIRGVVSNRANNTDNIFNVGTQVVNASLASVFPAGATYANGDIVEVHCTLRPCINVGGEFQASRIEVESAEDSGSQPGSGQRFEAEGLISGFTVHPGDFSVASVPVTTTLSTRFQGGIATDLANNVKVEAEGTWNGSALVASKIEFKRSVIRLQGVVTASTAPSFTLTITGAGAVTVEADSFTSGDFAGGAVPPVAAGCVQVRGQRKAGGGVVVTAGEIRASCSSSNRHFVQAPVELEVPEINITLLGFSLDVSNPTDNPPYKDVNDLSITRAVFFNTVTAATTNAGGSVPGTLVKVIFNDGLTTVRQVEIED